MIKYLLKFILNTLGRKIHQFTSMLEMEKPRSTPSSTGMGNNPKAIEWGKYANSNNNKAIYVGGGVVD